MLSEWLPHFTQGVFLAFLRRVLFGLAGSRVKNSPLALAFPPKSAAFAFAQSSRGIRLIPIKKPRRVENFVSETEGGQKGLDDAAGRCFASFFSLSI